jgi:dipeptidyl aminopeptidase/acylaminoacyl peptidase
MTPSRILALVSLLLVPGSVPESRAQTTGGYRKAPEEIRRILDIPPPPTHSLSPDRSFLLLAERSAAPSIALVSRPFLRLAGLRIDPDTNGPHLSVQYTGFTLQPTAGGAAVRVEMPPGAQLSLPVWSPDGKQFAFTNTTGKGIELWLGSTELKKARRVSGLAINAAAGQPLQWLPDGKTLLCPTIPAGRGAPPVAAKVPSGPVIQESTGKPAPARTYQDLLHNSHDERLFEYYCTAQLVQVDTAGDKVTPLGQPAIYVSCSPSPDGRYLLVVANHRPWSYILPRPAFPHTVDVLDRTGKRVHRVADLPLADAVPIEGVATGPRNIRWRPTAPATLVWVEALDGGDPARKVPRRDRLLSLAAPFTGEPVELARTEHRFSALDWADKGQALLAEQDRDKRRRRVFLLDTDSPEHTTRLLHDRSIQDRYGDPGNPLHHALPSGHTVLRQQGGDLFLVGAGASPKGERPFLDRFDLKTGKTTRLFQSAADCYEMPIDVLSNGEQILTRHESPTSPPNYRVRTLGKEDVRKLTDFEDPAPALRKITRQRVTYKRDDGVLLSFTLYLPPDYKPGTRLPTVLWAYPREYTDPSLAGQVAGSTSRYTTLAGPSHLFFLLAGYAVLDGATMPVVGTAEKANDTFVEQIVASARAAIDKAVELGVTDRDRVGVGGHSYGAFMTANLLAHSDLFRAGIARSGAYNRTLTPFGFQSERRTFWQAPEVYNKVSPFMHADKIKEPLLLIHGEADNNPGTFPVQSDRLYQAIRGQGGTVRYVSLPYESHGYQARESIEHTLAEMIDWFDRHVKHAPPRKR